MLPEVMEICEVSDDLRECPLWQDSELSDLASVSISLQASRGCKMDEVVLRPEAVSFKFSGLEIQVCKRGHETDLWLYET